MTKAGQLGGWLVAGLTAAVALLVRRGLDRRMELVTRACHELRGPITAARLGLELGTRGGELSPARIRAIDGELDRAALALDDLRGVHDGRLGFKRRSRFGLGCRSGPGWPGRTKSPLLGRLEPVDLAGLLADSVEAYGPAAAAAGKAVRLSCPNRPGCVAADRRRLSQAADNLIANAIEHGGGEVEVCGLYDGGGARIEVADDGPGLPAPVAELARRARSGRGSRGRGLAIASSVAAAHGGRLQAAPAVQGTRLVLEIPGWSPDEPARRSRRIALGRG